MANKLIKTNKDAELEPSLAVSKDEQKINQALYLRSLISFLLKLTSASDPMSLEEKIRRSLIRIADL